MKHLGRVFLALVLALSLGLSLVACNSTEAGPEDNSGDKQTVTTYDITIWCAENAVELTRQQVAAYNELETTKAENIRVNATVNPVGEGEAATSMITDVTAGADIYCFAQDQFARLVQSGALSELSASASAIVSEANDGGTVAAVTAGSKLYAYPMTSDNGYFMYYDKSVIPEEKIGSLEELIDVCEQENKLFSFNLEGSAWYNASFFFATGCKSEWETDDQGKFIGVNDTYNSAAGLAAVKGMRKLVSSPAYVDSSDASDLSKGSAIVVSGTWDYMTAYDILGDDLGAAELPSFTVDGETYHLGSFNGCKLMGVKPQTTAVRAAICHNLAQYLTSYDCQVERFDELAWGPSNIEAQNLEAVQENVALAAFFAQGNYSTPQGNINGGWWDIAKVIATGVRESDGSDDALQKVLDDYKLSIEGIFKMSDEEKNAWTLIGNLAESNWATDLAMAEQQDGTWMTTQAYEMTEETEFKIRQGKSWDNAYPAENYKVTAAGTYFVKLDPDTGEVTLIAA